LDGKGGLYSAGLAYTLVFFTTPRAFQTQYGGGDSDVFAAKVDFSQPAGPSIASVVNAASLFPGYSTPLPTGAVAPGEIVTLFGNGFGLVRPTVTFGTFPATVLYSSDCQINAVVPFEVNPGYTTLVTVQPNDQSSDQTLGPIKLPVVVAAPGIFTTILNQDSSVNSPSNPAARGSIVSVYMTGVGALSPPLADGVLGPLNASISGARGEPQRYHWRRECSRHFRRPGSRPDRRSDAVKYSGPAGCARGCRPDRDLRGILLQRGIHSRALVRGAGALARGRRPRRPPFSRVGRAGPGGPARSGGTAPLWGV
jgi:hypothetical protein